MRPNVPSLSAASNAWWSSKAEEVIRKRHKAFASAHRSDKELQTFSASRYASPVIAKVKAVAWHETCSSLSPKSVYSILRTIGGFASSSSSFPNFSNCSPPSSWHWFMPRLRTCRSCSANLSLCEHSCRAELQTPSNSSILLGSFSSLLPYIFHGY